MNAPLALALAAGMVGAINPCGFSLLPAYIGFFVTGDNARDPLERRLLRAVSSAVAVTVGFVFVFVTLGVLLDSVARRLRPNLPWFTMTVGALVVLAGITVIAGYRIPLPIPAIRVASGRGATAMALYGVVYALASLSCTLGPFLAITSTALNRSAMGGLATYVAYAVGMGTIITILALGTALARPGPGRLLRRLSRDAPRLGGLLMILSGGYAIWYARWELAVYGGNLNNDRVVNAGEQLRNDLVQLIERVGATRLLLVMVTAVALLCAQVLFRRRRTTAVMEDPDGRVT